MRKEIETAEIKFNALSPVFVALGDKFRQKIILEIANAGEKGISVQELSGKSILSRPAVSHHLKVLKDSGILEPTKKGTQIFYRLKLKEAFIQVKDFLQTIEPLI